MVSSAQLFSFVGMLITAAAGVFTFAIAVLPANMLLKLFVLRESTCKHTTAEPTTYLLQSQMLFVSLLSLLFHSFKMRKDYAQMHI